MIKIMCEQLEIWHNIIMYVHTMSYILISGKWYATVTMIRQGFAYIIVQVRIKCNCNLCAHCCWTWQIDFVRTVADKWYMAHMNHLLCVPHNSKICRGFLNNKLNAS